MSNVSLKFMYILGSGEVYKQITCQRCKGVLSCSIVLTVKDKFTGRWSILKAQDVSYKMLMSVFRFQSQLNICLQSKYLGIDLLWFATEGETNSVKRWWVGGLCGFVFFFKEWFWHYDADTKLQSTGVYVKLLMQKKKTTHLKSLVLLCLSFYFCKTFCFKVIL